MATTMIKDSQSDDQARVIDGALLTTGGGGGSNASVGPTGQPDLGYVTEIGTVNPSGNLAPARSNSNEDLFINQGVFNAPSNADSMSVNYASSTQTIYSFFNGGLSGTLVMTLTINYTDSTQNYITSVVRT